MLSSRQSFTRKERLSRSAAIRAIRIHGKKLTFGPITVYTLTNSVSFPRLVISLTTKTGKSVLRNRVRRLIREFFRKNKNSLGAADFFFYSNRDLSHLHHLDWKKTLDAFKQRLTSQQKGKPSL